MYSFKLLLIVLLLPVLAACDISVGGGGVFEVGQSVPPVRTKTLADADGDMAKLTSYRYPDPRMYELSFDDALKEGKPIIMEFATPGHCTQCDQQLQLLKVMLDRYGDKIIILHMDQYFNPEAYKAFQVRGEPWTFVINAQGKVDYIVPGRLLYSELDPVLTRLTGGPLDG